MPAKTTCPQPDELQRLATGHLPPADMEALAQHLEGCAACLSAVQSLSARDTLVDAVSGASTAGEAEEPAVTQLIAKLTNLKTGAAAPKVTFACPSCGKRIKAKAEFAGKKVKCPGCGAVAPAPKSAAEPETLPPAPADVGDEKTVPPAVHCSAERDKATQTSEVLKTSEVAAETWDFLAPAEQPDEIGRLGRYRILKVLGAGGMGVVFRAEDPDLERPVALKAMLPALAASPSSKKRFFREARAAAALKHDHVVAIYDVGESRGAPFLAMEFLDGEPLDKCLQREGKLPVAETLRIGREIAEGLAAAHDKGLIHRDIKPGNIWLEASPGRKSGESRVKILDFGLARTVGDQAGLTQSGAIVGTPAYMAPEQARGQDVDHRCDLFSLGCVLYRMSTGETPFKGSDTLSMLSSLAMDTPKTPRELEPTLPKGLSELIMRLLAKKAEERPGSAHEVIERVRELEVEVTPHARSTSHAGLGVRKRSRTLTAVVAAGLLGCAALVAGVIWIMTDNGTIEIRTDGINDVKIVVEQDGKQVLVMDPASKQTWVVNTGKYTVKLEGNPAGFEIAMPTDQTFVMKRGDKQIVSIRKVPDALAKAGAGKVAPPSPTPASAPSPVKLDPARIPAIELADFHAAKLPVPAELVAVAGENRGGHFGWTRTVEFSPDGKSAVSVGGSVNGTSVMVWDTATMRQRWKLAGVAGGHSWNCAIFTADGQQVLAASQKGLALLDAGTGIEVEQRKRTPDEDITAIAISPDGEQVLAGARKNKDYSVILWEGKIWKEIRRFEGTKQPISSVAFSGDGRRVAASCRGGSGDAGSVHVWDNATGKELFSLKNIACLSASLSGDGKRVLISSYKTGQHNLYLLEVDTGKKLFESSEWNVGPAAFSPDGRRAAQSYRGKDLKGMDRYAIILWNVETGQEIRRLLGHSSSVNALAFSRDGGRLLSAAEDRTLRLWDVEAAQELLPRTGHCCPITALEFAPDGKTLISGSADRTVRFWDLAGPVPAQKQFLDVLWQPAGSIYPIRALPFCPDSNQLVFLEPFFGSFDLAIWDLKQSAWTKKIGKPSTRFITAKFAPRGKTLVVGADRSPGVFIYDLSGPEPRIVREIGKAPVFVPFAFSPDGNTLAYLSNNEGPALLDLQAAAKAEPVLLPFRAPGVVLTCLAFSRDGKTLAAAGTDGSIRFWDTAKPGDTDIETARIRILPAPKDRLYASIAFAPDGKTLFWKGRDGRLMLWDWTRRVKLKEWLLPGTDEIFALSPDGTLLAAGTDKGAIFLLRFMAAPAPGTKTEPSASPLVKDAPLSPKGSPLDKLNPKAIPASERFPWQPKELVAVIGSHRGRHWGEIEGSAIAVSPDGGTVATGGADAIVRFWDATTLDARGASNRHTAPIQSLAYVPAGVRQGLIWWGCFQKVGLLDPKTGRFDALGPDWTLPASSYVQRIVVSPDGKYLAYSGGFDAVFLWDVSGAKPKQLAQWKPKHEWWHWPVSFSPQGDLVAYVAAPGEVRVLRVNEPGLPEVARLRHDTPVMVVRFAPKGKRLATASAETISLWDLEGKEPVQKVVAKGKTAEAGYLAFSPDGGRLAVNWGPNVRILDLANPDPPAAQVLDWIGHYPTFTDSGRFFTVYENTLRRWDLGKKGFAELMDPAAELASCPRGTDRMQVSPDDRRLAAPMRDGEVKLWDLDGDQPKVHASWPGGPPTGIPTAFSHDGTLLASYQHFKFTKLWEISGAESHLSERYRVVVNQTLLAFSPDGKRAFGLQPGKPGKFVVWDASGPVLLLKTAVDAGMVQGYYAPQNLRLRMSANGKTVVHRSDHNKVRVWDVSGAEPRSCGEVEILGGADIWDVAFSPDGKTLACGTSGWVELWDFSGAQPRSLERLTTHFGDGYAVSFTPDGKQLLYTAPGKLVLWDFALQAPERVWELPAAPRQVQAARDGRHIIVYNGNGTIYILRLAPPPLPSQSPSAVWTPRTIAEWTIHRGGKVWIGDRNDIAKLEDLPAGEFEISKIFLDDIENLQDKDLTTIVSWKGLNIGGLDFAHVELTDDGLRRLAQRGPELIGFGASATPITGVGFDAWAERSVPFLVLIACPKINAEGWKSIARLKAPLIGLWVNDSPLTDSGLAEIAGRHAELQELYAPKTRLTDAAAESLQKLTRLKKLDLSKTAITDAALAKLVNLTQLREINLKSTKVTAAAISALQKALPKCNIQSDRSAIQP